MPYIPLAQIKKSLRKLPHINPFFGMSFLAFKKTGLPIGRTTQVVFSRISEAFLREHYRPSQAYQGYYNPLRTSDPGKRWVAARYPSNSLQRITTDTFSDALLHPKTSSLWGWEESYIEQLAGHLERRLIPAFHLAVWLFRHKEWPAGSSPATVTEHFFEAFSISDIEIARLFEGATPLRFVDPLQDEPVPENELLDEIGWPPGVVPEEGLALHYLDMHGAGPARRLLYEPSERLNILAGDNSLGKTFLLDCAWWAMTGSWSAQSASPRDDVSKGKHRIGFRLRPAARAKTFAATYDWDKNSWQHPAEVRDRPELVLYARHDGSFAVWDSVRTTGPLVLSRHELWDGKSIKNQLGRGRRLCNGLLQDWVSWQSNQARYEEQFRAFSATLETLSSSGSPAERLSVGDLKRLPQDARDFPSLRLPYGEVAIVHCSAGVQRIVALSYLLVWAWFEHLENWRLQRRDTRRGIQHKVIVLVDEIEAHLHPQWQRIIVPALINAVSELGSRLHPQLHVATHSPLVLAGTETIADHGRDCLHHLRLEEKSVTIHQIPWMRRGRIDQWLISDAFGLGHPRSLQAERAIEEARSLQNDRRPNREGLRQAHEKLLGLLAPDDDFWPRWVFYAERHGVDV